MIATQMSQTGPNYTLNKFNSRADSVAILCERFVDNFPDYPHFSIILKLDNLTL